MDINDASPYLQSYEEDKPELFHVTKSGIKILLVAMETSHLVNTINMLNHKAKEGILVRWGCWDPDGMDYDEDVVTGKAALRMLGISKYLREAKRRNLNI